MLRFGMSGKTSLPPPAPAPSIAPARRPAAPATKAVHALQNATEFLESLLSQVKREIEDGDAPAAGSQAIQVRSNRGQKGPLACKSFAGPAANIINAGKASSRPSASWRGLRDCLQLPSELVVKSNLLLSRTAKGREQRSTE